MGLEGSVSVSLYDLHVAAAVISQGAYQVRF